MTDLPDCGGFTPDPNTAYTFDADGLTDEQMRETLAQGFGELITADLDYDNNRDLADEATPREVMIGVLRMVWSKSLSTGFRLQPALVMGNRSQPRPILVPMIGVDMIAALNMLDDIEGLDGVTWMGHVADTWVGLASSLEEAAALDPGDRFSMLVGTVVEPDKPAYVFTMRHDPIDPADVDGPRRCPGIYGMDEPADRAEFDGPSRTLRTAIAHGNRDRS